MNRAFCHGTHIQSKFAPERGLQAKFNDAFPKIDHQGNSGSAVLCNAIQRGDQWFCTVHLIPEASPDISISIFAFFLWLTFPENNPSMLNYHGHPCWHMDMNTIAGLSLVLRQAKERRRYFETTSVIGWVPTENQLYRWKWYGISPMTIPSNY